MFRVYNLASFIQVVSSTIHQLDLHFFPHHYYLVTGSFPVSSPTEFILISKALRRGNVHKSKRSKSGVKAVSTALQSASSWRKSVSLTKVIHILFPDVKKSENLATNPNGWQPTLVSPGGIPVPLPGIWLSATTQNTMWAPLQGHQSRIMRNSGSTSRQRDKGHATDRQDNPLGTSAQYDWALYQRGQSGVRHLRWVSSSAETKTWRQRWPWVSDGPWLVGNKLSYTDIVFIPWQRIIVMELGKDEYNEDDFPLIEEWLGRMTSRETVKTVLESAQPLKWGTAWGQIARSRSCNLELAS